jgi:hypothetical protein
MLFIELIRLELEKLEFKLIIRLVVIFNYIVGIDIIFLIDAISCIVYFLIVKIVQLRSCKNIVIMQLHNKKNF